MKTNMNIIFIKPSSSIIDLEKDFFLCLMSPISLANFLITLTHRKAATAESIGSRHLRIDRKPPPHPEVASSTGC